MNNTTSPVVRRLCKGGCGQWFTPPASRPGQEYIHGHKKGCDAAERVHSKPAPRAGGRSEAERRTLDYRMALASARREQAEVEKEIDVVDEEIQLLREKLAVRDNEKETLTERHLNLGASMMALESLAGGKSLVRQVAAEGNNGSL